MVREEHPSVASAHLPYMLRLGMELTAQIQALTGNRTHTLLVYATVLSRLSCLARAQMKHLEIRVTKNVLKTTLNGLISRVERGSELGDRPTEATRSVDRSEQRRGRTLNTQRD